VLSQNASKENRNNAPYLAKAFGSVDQISRTWMARSLTMYPW
jgi:hypothetical protein